MLHKLISQKVCIDGKTFNAYTLYHSNKMGKHNFHSHPILRFVDEHNFNLHFADKQTL